MVTLTAQNLLDWNNWSTSDISVVNLENVIDGAVDQVNLLAGTSIAYMGGVAGSKELSCTGAQMAVVKPVAILMVRAFLDRGPNTAIQALSVSALISDPQYSFYKWAINNGLHALRGMSFKRA